MKRGCGVLLHVSSLPSGDFKSAFEFIDFLQNSGVKYWQVLAMNPTDCDSPYSPISVFAGNPKFISEPYASADKTKLQSFIKDNKFWLESFSEYMSKKEPNVDHVLHQFIFFEQWSEVKKYANSRGIMIIGDAPIYPSMDSADVWANQGQFDLTGEAGVPPDYFNEKGQHWGNPLYNFKQMARSKYKWWIQRIKQMQKMYDIIRIDHFRAFDSFYKIPKGSKDASQGIWCKGPGIKFFDTIKDAVPNLQVILEDLGDLTESASELREQTGWPGMRVMQFGFDGNSLNEHLPVNYPENCAAYIGTHDNDTFVGFLNSLTEQSRQIVDNYLSSFRLDVKDVARLAIENIIKSKANLVVLSMQDLLFQDSKSRMNTPGTVGGGNWKYKVSSSDFSKELSDYLKMIIKRSNRC